MTSSQGKVAIIRTAVRNSNQWAGTLRSVGGRIPIISYVIVGAIDVAEWLALPEAEQDFSDLLAILFVDISKIAMSVITGAVTAVALLSTLPVWGVVVLGLELQLLLSSFWILLITLLALRKLQIK